MERSQAAVQELVGFFDSLDKDLRLFFLRFIDSRVCFRCILMLYREHTLALYRIQDYTPVYKHIEREPQVALCSICQGVNQHCDKNLETLVKKIAD